MRDDGLTCKDCQAYNADKHECRRNPPVMVPIPQQALQPGQVNFASIGLYPATPHDGWCMALDRIAPIKLIN
jgi:hypothetical protein